VRVRIVVSEYAERLQKAGRRRSGGSSRTPSSCSDGAEDERPRRFWGATDRTGKSAIYQVSALLLTGPTLVVSPLLAVQRDQVAGIGGSTTPEAVAVNCRQGSQKTGMSNKSDQSQPRRRNSNTRRTPTMSISTSTAG
jgi:hypothetical protein